MLFVVAYDVVDDRRRERAANVLRDFGIRTQYSVYECHLETSQAEQLLDRLRGVVDAEVDRVRLYRVCGECVRVVQSLGPDEYEGERRAIVI